MRNALPFKPRERPARSTAVIARWKRERREWMAAVAPTSQFHLLFEHIPGVYFSEGAKGPGTKPGRSLNKLYLHSRQQGLMDCSLECLAA
jgi:hypothetical protein